MKKNAITLCAVLAILAGVALVAGCSSTPKNTDDYKWRYENTYDDLDDLMSRIRGHFKHLQKASYDLNRMAMKADSLAWDAEVIAALAPQMKGLAEEPVASNTHFWACSSIIEQRANSARYALQNGNWQRAREQIKMIERGLETYRKDFDSN